MNLGKQIEVREVSAPISAANNTDSNSDRIDMAGYEGVMFITPITDSVDTGVATITAEQNTSDSDSGMAALSGATATATSAANDDLNGTLLVLDVFRPTERYVQVAITSATANIAFGNTIALLYGKKKLPVAKHSTVQQQTVVVGPDEA